MDSDQEILEGIRQMLQKSKKSKPLTKCSAGYSPYDVPHQKKNRSKRMSKSQFLPSLTDSVKESNIAERTISLPYFESVALVEESLKVARQWSQSNNKDRIPEQVGAQTQLLSIIKRFPRFCEGLNIQSLEISSYKQRSTLWLARVIEESYDAASIECSKTVCAARTRRRFNMDLGAMNCFPHSVRRYIGRKYRYFLSSFLMV
jgi:hypothetical protein